MWLASQTDALGATESDGLRLRRWWSPLLPWAGVGLLLQSISSALSEFHTVLGRFVRSLRPGAPFMAAFMKNSLGYNVGRRWFPAVVIAGDEVENCLAGEKEGPRIHRLDKADNPLRNGCDGMIMTIGRVRKIRQNGEVER